MCCWYLCFAMVSGRHVDYNFESHFSCLNRHFLKKNPWAHILSIFVYTLVVSFFSRKRLAHADLIRRRCQREAEEAVVYILHAARSWAQLRASPADRPQSEQIWCSQVIGGRPRDLHQYGKGRTPSRTSHATRRTALAGTLSGIRTTWPKSERRRRRTINWILSRPDLV